MPKRRWQGLPWDIEMFGQKKTFCHGANKEFLFWIPKNRSFGGTNIWDGYLLASMSLMRVFQVPSAGWVIL